MVVYGLYQALTALAISTLSNLTGMRMSLMFDFAAEIYCNAWYLLPWYLAEGKHVASAGRRGVVPVTGADPYAWKGYDPVSDSVWLQRCIGR